MITFGRSSVSLPRSISTRLINIHHKYLTDSLSPLPAEQLNLDSHFCVETEEGVKSDPLTGITFTLRFSVTLKFHTTALTSGPV